MMNVSRTTQNDFVAHRPLPGLAFEHNASVAAIDGEYIGRSGSIISIEEFGDDPVYLVELESGVDVLIRQTQLRAGEV
jgi:hypothetical protein